MVIRIPNWLGDAIMATPVYYNLSLYEKIYLFGPPNLLPLFRYFPNVVLLPYHKDNLKENIKTLKLYKDHVGLLLTNSFSSAWLFFRAGLKERWGYARDLRSFLLTKAVKPPKRELHQKDYYLYLLRALNFKLSSEDLVLFLKDEVVEKTRLFLKSIDKEIFRHKLIAIAPGAAYGPAKMWPKENYRKLALYLTKSGYKILIMGGEKEFPLGEYIKDKNNEILNLCGKTDLLTVAGVFSIVEAVISNDSGLMHLAAALKVPQIAIFGSTDPELTGPLNPNAVVLKKDLPCSPCFKRTCKHGHYLCLRDISVEEVISALENFH